MKKYVCTICMLIAVFPVFCQTDSLYQEARQHAYDGRYAQATHDLKLILAQNPEYYDALFLQALVIAWDGEFQEALRLLNTLINKFPPTQEAIEAISRINYWAGENIKSIVTAEKGLGLFPANLNLMYIRAQALAAQHQYDEAIMGLDSLLQLNENHEEAQALKKRLQLLNLKNAAGIEYTHSQFSNTFTPWHQLSAYYKRTFNNTLMIGRLQYARMFDRQGLQAELDAYPKIDNKTYAYLNVGASSASIFPKFHWGAELYRLLPQQWEASAGMRGLYFQNTPIHIYTAQLGHYFPKYWVSGRVFMSTLGNKAPLTSLLTARRYLEHQDHYASLYLGSGATPVRINSLAEIQRLDASWVGIDYQHPLQERRWILRSALTLQHEVYPEIRLTKRLSFSIHLERRF